MRQAKQTLSLSARLCLAALVLLSGCNLPTASTPQGGVNASTTLTPFQPGSPAEATATAEASQVWWVSPALPAAFINELALPEGAELAADEANASLRIEVGGEQPIASWVYALVAPFPTITEEVSLDDLQAAWRGEEAGPFAGVPLLLSPETEAVFAAWWGQPATATRAS
jgi:poly-gamma-glutamate synthesis protein (capsule biosynthesis protein)